MELLIENIDDLRMKIKYNMQNKFDNQFLNELYNNWLFLSEKVNELNAVYSFDICCVLYSEYYWCTKFVHEYRNQHGADAGLEQQQFMLLEKISSALGEVDWNLIQNIEESM